MKREDISNIFEGATDGQINSILNIHSADIGKVKGDYESLSKDLKLSKETITNLTAELQTLKDSNATAEDWKSKFEELEKKVKEDAENAKLEREKAERESNILTRYNAVCVDKEGKPLEWSHEAIKDAYLRKFSQAIEDAVNTGKSDAEIFHALTKDDSAAFKTIQPEVKLPGAQPLEGTDIGQIKQIMGIK